MKYLIQFENVTIMREEQLALDRVSLTIRAGEHVAILGPNGSGKSTLIKAITRECYPRYAPPACALRIWGEERWNIFDLRALLGIVTNDLIHACTAAYPVMETVLSGFFSSVGVWPHHEVTPEMIVKAEELMELLEISHLRDRNLTEMSSGEVRRAVIARSLAHNPQALLLDEPSNSLDIRSMRELRDITRKLARAGITIILVTHHLPDIIPEIERVVCLKQGHVFRDGPKRDVLTEPTLAELFGVPVRLVEQDGFYNLW